MDNGLRSALRGASTLLSEYSDGISISTDTWRTIVWAGGRQIEPYLQNRGSQTVYFKPEYSAFGLDNSGAYELGPHMDLYIPIDGINHPNIPAGQVYKLPTDDLLIVHGKGSFERVMRTWMSRFAVCGYYIVPAPDPTWYALRDAISK